MFKEDNLEKQNTFGGFRKSGFELPQFFKKPTRKIESLIMCITDKKLPKEI